MALFWFAILALVLAAYFSALALALMSFSRSVLEERLEARGKTVRGEWLFTHLNETIMAVSFVRTVVRLSFFALVFMQCAPMDDEVAATLGELLTALGISIACLWGASTVLPLAISRYASEGLIVSSLPLLRGLNLLFLPITRSLAFVDEMVKRLTGANLTEAQEAEHELLRSIEDSRREGGLDQDSAELLENVVEFRSTDVGEVMTPRTDIDGIEVTDDLAEIRSFISEVRHSRIPVYRENLDNIVGILYVKDLIEYLGEDGSDFELEPILRTPIVVPESKPVPALLADFQRSEVHMAIVIDEYGGTAGLVTIEDVLEELVGEIKDEHDPEQDEIPTLERVADDRADVDGRYHIDDLNEDMALELPEDDDYDTVGGFLLAQFGRVPQEGESIVAYGARFTTLAATPTHIERITVELLADVTVEGEPIVTTQDTEDAA